MARVLVVSRNPAMAMGLSATDHDIVELKPPTFGDWIAGRDAVDALVLDLEAPTLAAAAVVNLRAHGKLAPVLLVASDRPGWGAPEMGELVGATVLHQPITRAGLLSAVESMLNVRDDEPDDGPFIPAEDEREDAPLHTEAALQELRQDERTQQHEDPEAEITRLLVGSRLVVDAPQAAEPPAEPVVPHQSPTPETAPRRPPAAAAASKRARRRRDSSATALSGEEYTLSAVPRTRRSPGGAQQPTREATSRVLDDLDQLRTPPPKTDQPPRRAGGNHARPKQRPRGSKVSTESTASVPAAPTVTAEDPADLASRLAKLADDLYGVPETAQVVIDDAVLKIQADAGALLCPDGGEWRVSGGVELRPLEHRFILSEDDWIVQEVAQQRLGIIIEDTDIARERLHGAPLASWRHLLAAPVPAVRGVLILARREDLPFTEDDLGLVADLGIEAGPLIKAAMETRDLARRLARFQDEDDRLR